MSLTSSMEDYLKAILVLHQRHGNARCVDVADYLGVSKPSVSRARRRTRGIMILSHDPLKTWGEFLLCSFALAKRRHGRAMTRQS